MKHCIGIESYKSDEIGHLIKQSLYWKKNKKTLGNDFLKDIVLGMIFEKPSTRTRIAFEVAIANFGGRAIFLNRQDLQLSRNESIEDTARVLKSYLNGIIIRTHRHDVLTEFAHYAGIPIINALSEKEHPCQAIADLATIQELCGDLAEQNVLFIGRYNNVVHSLMLGCLKMGMRFDLICPQDAMPSKEIINLAEKTATENGAKFYYSDDPKESAKRCTVVYTDVWRSMGDEGSFDMQLMKNYQVNTQLLQFAKKGIKVMHCLPAHKTEEITEEVFEEHAKTIFQQAENKLYAHMAILEYIFNNNYRN